MHMKEHHRQVIDDMIEDKQWEIDNGPRTIDLDHYFKYSGEVEKETITLIAEKAIDRVQMVVRDGGIYTVLSEKRSRILAYWLDHPNKPMKEIGEILGCDYVTVSRTIKKYLDAFRDIKK